jgi:hypothetical protein
MLAVDGTGWAERSTLFPGLPNGTGVMVNAVSLRDPPLREAAGYRPY